MSLERRERFSVSARETSQLTEASLARTRSPLALLPAVDASTLSEEELRVVAELIRDMGELLLALRVWEHVVERVRTRVGSEEG